MLSVRRRRRRRHAACDGAAAAAGGGDGRCRRRSLSERSAAPPRGLMRRLAGSPSPFCARPRTVLLDDDDDDDFRPRSRDARASPSLTLPPPLRHRQPRSLKKEPSPFFDCAGPRAAARRAAPPCASPPFPRRRPSHHHQSLSVLQTDTAPQFLATYSALSKMMRVSPPPASTHRQQHKQELPFPCPSRSASPLFPPSASFGAAILGRAPTKARVWDTSLSQRPISPPCVVVRARCFWCLSALPPLPPDKMGGKQKGRSWCSSFSLHFIITRFLFSSPTTHTQAPPPSPTKTIAFPSLHFHLPPAARPSCARRAAWPP